MLTNISPQDIYSLITLVQQHFISSTTSPYTSIQNFLVMPNEATTSAPQLISLSSPQLSDTKVHQSDQVHVKDSPPIPIPTIQLNNTIVLGYHMITHSKSDIFKSRQILNLHATTNSPPKSIESTTITQSQKSLQWLKAICEEYDTLLHNAIWTLVLFYYIKYHHV